MHITANVNSRASSHAVSISTAGNTHPLAVPTKPGGQGSAVNGGEFLMLALATCYCNDIYREVARLKIEVTAVEVEAAADFEGGGLAASNIRYKARVSSPAGDAELAALLRETDTVAEVHNTLRSGAAVEFVPWQSAT